MFLESFVTILRPYSSYPFHFDPVDKPQNKVQLTMKCDKVFNSWLRINFMRARGGGEAIYVCLQMLFDIDV